jgi:hypothetical protein
VKESRKVLCGEEVKTLRPHWESLHKKKKASRHFQVRFQGRNKLPGEKEVFDVRRKVDPQKTVVGREAETKNWGRPLISFSMASTRFYCVI